MGKILNLFQEQQDRISRPEVGIETSTSSQVLELVITLPHSEEAEKSILSCVLQSPSETIDECEFRRFSEADFYFDKYREVYRQVVALLNAKKTPDFLSLIQSLQRNNLLEQIGGSKFLTELFAFVPDAKNLGYYLEIVIEKSRKRQVIIACTDSIRRCEDDQNKLDIITDPIRSTISRLTERESHFSSESVKNDVISVIEEIEQIFETRGAIIGMTSGHDWLDKYIDGLHPGDLLVVTGDNDHAGTAFFLSLINHFSLELKKPVTIFSFRMPKQTLIKRLLFSKANIDEKRIRAGYLSEKDFPALTSAASKLADSTISVNDLTISSITQLRDRVQLMQSEQSADIIFLDRIDLLPAEFAPTSNPQLYFRSVLLELKSLALKFQIPIVVNSQFRSLESHQQSEVADWSNIFGRIADVICSFTYSEEGGTDLDLSKPTDNLSFRIELDYDETTGSIQLQHYDQDEQIASTSEEHVPATELTIDDLLRRYHELVDQKLLGNLNAEHSVELEALKGHFDKLDALELDKSHEPPAWTEKTKHVFETLSVIENHLKSLLGKY